jgi:octaprenyl-diphosphate synthase
MQIQDIFQFYEKDLRQVEDIMERHFQSDITLIPDIVRHLVGGGGKRFRPLLVLASSALCGYHGDHRYPLAAAIEFIHTATLLHDDVVDQAHIRRGRISANNIWGNAASVLVGDFLFSQAFRLMTADGNLLVMKLLSTTTNRMSEGEAFQLTRSGDIGLTEAEYLSIIERKTAILISSACAIGAILGGALDHEIERLSAFGNKVGMAFQITDDTLDYMAREEEFGKAIGKDLNEGKVTLPLIRTLQQCSQEEKILIEKIFQDRLLNDTMLEKIMTLIGHYDGIPYSLQRAQQYIKEGRDTLSGFGDSDEKKALLCIADFVVERQT